MYKLLSFSKIYVCQAAQSSGNQVPQTFWRATGQSYLLMAFFIQYQGIAFHLHSMWDIQAFINVDNEQRYEVSGYEGGDLLLGRPKSATRCILRLKTEYHVSISFNCIIKCSQPGKTGSARSYLAFVERLGDKGNRVTNVKTFVGVDFAIV